MQLFGREIKLKPEAVVIIVAVLMLLGCLVGYIFFRDKSEIIIEAGKTGTEDAGTAASVSGKTGKESGIVAGGITGAGINGDAIGSDSNNSGDGNTVDGVDTVSDAAKAGEMIKIYIVGCVKEPGIVTIQKGQLIHDAITQAGGLTDEADADNINMVYKLNENVMLYIKSKKETEQNTAVMAVQKAAGKTDRKEEPIKGDDAVVVVKSGESAVIIGEGDNTSGDGVNEDDKIRPVNINTATVDELDTLPGIGEATAKDIIAFREKNEGFKKIEDIMRVPRIKQTRFDNIKDYITVD